VRYRFSVTDSGAGIGPEDLDRLFQPFSQVDASSTRRFGGTGLGLTICRRMANIMGGDISVVSTRGVGSTFTFDVEWRCSTGRRRPTPRRHPPPTASEVAALNVLIVEDHPVNRMILEAWMASVGHSCGHRREWPDRASTWPTGSGST
jgi:hypothetical protein